MSLHHKPGDMAMSDGCTTTAVAINAPSSPATTFSTVPLSANVTTAKGCKPTEETYQWSFVSVPPSSRASFNSASVADPSFVVDEPNGTWRVHLTYNNVGTGQTFDSDAQVRSNGCFAAPPLAYVQTYLPSVSPPFADPTPFAPSDASAFGAADLSFAAGTGVQLSGLSSSDPAASAGCGTVPALQFTWTLVVQPPGSTAKLSMASGPTTNLTLDVAGRYVVGLVVSDGYVTSAPSYLRIEGT
jgi:hypothetical protein